MKKIIILPLVIVFSFGFTVNLFGQVVKQTKEAEFNSGDGEQLYKKLHDFAYTHQTERGNLDSLCLTGSAFARFKIDTKNSVKDIGFSIGTPSAIMEYMSKALKWTNGNWTVKLIDGKPSESQYMMLPIIYYLGITCQGKNEVDNNFWRMLWFDGSGELKNGTYYRRANETLDCVLLHPYMIKSPIN
jgi:hypothetical protein